MSQSNRNILIVVIVLAIVMVCCVALVAGSLLLGRTGVRLAQNFEDLGALSAASTFDRTFPVSGPAELVVDLNVGSIEVSVGSGDVIDVQAEITAYGSTTAAAEEALQRITIEATQADNRVHVVAQWGNLGQSWPGRSPRVDLRISVPASTGTTLSVSVGDISLTGVEGDVDIRADVGKVAVQDVRVPNKLEIRTDVADISFESALSEGAEYGLRSDVGRITLTLPADSRFEIDAESSVGDVAVDFDVVGETSREFVGKRVQGVVGDAADSQLFLRSDVGSISVRRQ